MSRPLMAGVVLVSTLLMTISCVLPPRVTRKEAPVGRQSRESPVGRQSRESPVDALFATLPEPEAT